MNASQALLKLLEGLAIIGFNRDSLTVSEQTVHEDDHQVIVGVPVSSGTLEVTICRFWAYPGCACFFVNYRRDANNFMCCAGTPHIERCLFDLGSAINMVPPVERI